MGYRIGLSLDDILAWRETRPKWVISQLLAEVERLSDIAMRNADLLIEADERAHAAEVEVATLLTTVRRVKALADNALWQGYPGQEFPTRDNAQFLLIDRAALRAALRNEP